MRYMLRVRKGFTLVELVVITPLIILIIGGMVIAALQASHAALRSSGKSQLQYDVLSALDRIEQDVRLSRRQVGSDPVTLTLFSVATDKNPLDPSRSLINKANCQTVAGGISPDDALEYKTIYQVSGQSLLRRTEFGTDLWCSNGETATKSKAWQRHEQDEILISNANAQISFDYSDSRGIGVTISAKRSIAGKEVEYTGQLFATTFNS